LNDPGRAAPLRGIRILELGSYISAPFAAMILAELGADVIKVERPNVGEPFRASVGGEIPPRFVAYNRAKRSVAIDFKQEEGPRVLARLIARSDVLLTNYREDVLESIGADPERARRANPKIVFCRIRGAPVGHPFDRLPVYDTIAQAQSGYLRLMDDQPVPALKGPATSDGVTSLYSVIGILAELVTLGRLSEKGAEDGAAQPRRTTGVFDVDMISSMLHFLNFEVAYLGDTGQAPSANQRVHQSLAFVFDCADGGCVAVHVSTSQIFWSRLLEALSVPVRTMPPWADEYVGRVSHYDELAGILGDIFRTKSAKTWLDALASAGVPAASVADIAQAVEGSDAAATDDSARFARRDQAGRLYAPMPRHEVAIGSPHGLGAYATSPSAPLLGVDTRPALREVGFTDSEIDDLCARGVVSGTP
jgi:crotonobetainyl-CoA:carnitine CoA-transferase CaiB-like acyl-CoA transferase